MIDLIFRVRKECEQVVGQQIALRTTFFQKIRHRSIPASLTILIRANDAPNERAGRWHKKTPRRQAHRDVVRPTLQLSLLGSEQTVMTVISLSGNRPMCFSIE